MCGISGIVGQACHQETIDSMVASMAHRGPDASDTFISPTRVCALGHNRLSIIDLSSSGTQPMTDVSGRYTIAFNGEIYNYRELRSKVGDYPFKSASDTEVLLAGYIKYGASFLQSLIGMFAFAIWDEQERSLFCARDRLGIKPFHYALMQQSFFFASEAKAILAAGLAAEPDWDTWGDYLRHGLYDHTNNTFFKNIELLPAGHFMVFKNGAASIQKYWDIDPQSENTFTGTIDEAADAFNALMHDSVRLRMRSDVPVGVNLSGGLDSASLFTYVDEQEETSDSLACFTYAFGDAQYDETDFAHAVPHKKDWKKRTAIATAEKIWGDVDRLMYHEEAPYGGIGTLSYFHLHEEIKKSSVIVVLEGQGVDELLGGYVYYENKGQDSGVYQDGTRFLREECFSADFRDKKIPHPSFSKPFKSSLSNALYTDIRHTKLPRVLRMNDRLSMAFGRELRVPFLDHRVVEFCFTLPDHFKIQNGQRKYLLRYAMRKKLPESIRTTPKRPVVTPQREWMKGPLKKEIEHLLSSSSFKDLSVFDVDACRIAFEEFCQGNGDNAFFIWQWINLNSWVNTFVKSSAGVKKQARHA
jgi:asparagine synthase (glutamine-hydrolysing)